ncbi:MAG: hypothetical protein ACLUVM_08535 [Blautia faecis]
MKPTVPLSGCRHMHEPGCAVKEALGSKMRSAEYDRLSGAAPGIKREK